jgi:hypothetical protein
MATIIAGGFDVYSKTQEAIGRLRAAGVLEQDLCEFRVNPPGEHDRLAMGGDHHASQGAKSAGAGATTGAAIGAAAGVAVGIAAMPVAGPAGIIAGAGVGTYTGSLVGGMASRSSEPQPDHTDVRPAEALVAVNVSAGTVAEEEVIRIFEECGAHQVERAEGLWENGAWADFDAVSPPQLIGGSDQREHRL